MTEATRSQMVEISERDGRAGKGASQLTAVACNSLLINGNSKGRCDSYVPWQEDLRICEGVHPGMCPAEAQTWGFEDADGFEVTERSHLDARSHKYWLATTGGLLRFVGLGLTRPWHLVYSCNFHSWPRLPAVFRWEQVSMPGLCLLFLQQMYRQSACCIAAVSAAHTCNWQPLAGVSCALLHCFLCTVATPKLEL